MTDTLRALSPYTIPKPTDRWEWLVARHRDPEGRALFNASDAGVLYNCHPFRSLADVAVEKLQPEPTDDGTNDAMDRGNRLESVLLQKWGDDHGVTVETPERLYVCGRVMATLDGVPVGSTTDAVEAKSTRDIWTELPPHVHFQCVAQVAAAGIERVHVIALDGTMRFKGWTVEPSEAEVTDLLDRAEHFMSFIDLGMVPEGVALDYHHVAALHPLDTGAVREVTDPEVDVVRAWAEARQRRIDAEADEKVLRDEMARLFGEDSVLTHDGVPLASWKASKPSMRFDAQWLKADSPQTYEAYVREVPGPRTLRPLKGLGE